MVCLGRFADGRHVWVTEAEYEAMLRDTSRWLRWSPAVYRAQVTLTPMEEEC